MLLYLRYIVIVTENQHRKLSLRSEVIALLTLGTRGSEAFGTVLREWIWKSRGQWVKENLDHCKQNLKGDSDRDVGDYNADGNVNSKGQSFTRKGSRLESAHSVPLQRNGLHFIHVPRLWQGLAMRSLNSLRRSHKSALHLSQLEQCWLLLAKCSIEIKSKETKFYRERSMFEAKSKVETDVSTKEKKPRALAPKQRRRWLEGISVTGSTPSVPESKVEKLKIGVEEMAQSLRLLSWGCGFNSQIVSQQPSVTPVPVYPSSLLCPLGVPGVLVKVL